MIKHAQTTILMSYLTMNAKEARVNSFNRWWRRSKRNHSSLVWLTSHAKRVAFAYNIPPHTWDEVIHINKRFLHSEYKRLSRRDAWKLWKFIHPLSTNRIARITATGDYLLSVKHDKSTKSTKKPVTVVYKNKKRLTTPL